MKPTNLEQTPWPTPNKHPPPPKKIQDQRQKPNTKKGGKENSTPSCHCLGHDLVGLMGSRWADGFQVDGLCDFSGGCALSRLTDKSCSGTSFPLEKSSPMGSMAIGFGFAWDRFAGFLFKWDGLFWFWVFFFFFLNWLCCIFGWIWYYEALGFDDIAGFEKIVILRFLIFGF